MKQPISLVLSGGAARGLAHIGVIEVLEKQGFEIKSIAGASIGALIGAMYAAGSLKEYKKWALKLDKINVFKLIDFSFSTQGLIKGDRFFNKMKPFFPDKNIEDLSIPYAAVATDITNEKEVVFTKGSIYNAVRASIAIPTVFTPVKKSGMILVDGCVLNPVPINRVKRTKGDLLVVVDLYADVPYKKRKRKSKKQVKAYWSYLRNIAKFKKKLNEITPRKNIKSLGYFKLLDATTSAMVHQIRNFTLEMYKPDIIINISRYAGNTYDFYKADEFIKMGKKAAKKYIAQYDNAIIERYKKQNGIK